MENKTGISVSFRFVEDWLRSLGLICFAQAFYDNGYEDLEICKQIGEDDLNVIGVTNVKDRNDILAGVIRLKQKAVYFELEPENDEATISQEVGEKKVKLDPFLLLTKVKAEIEKDCIDLTKPPYFYPDGSFGDLCSLAQRLSYQLQTYEDDVVNALTQLRRRQLPADSYNDVAQMMQLQREQEVKNKVLTLEMAREEPEDYLNVEIPYRRTTSLSKHDKRITKSTTNIFEAVLEMKNLTKKKVDHHKKRKSVVKSQSVYDKQSRSFLSGLNILKRTSSGGTTGKTGNRNNTIAAKDITLGQDELINLMTKVKLGEITQENVVDQVNEHYRQSIAFENSPPSSPDYEKTNLSKKEKRKLDKEDKKRRKTMRKKADHFGNSHFYTSGLEGDNKREIFSAVETQVEDIIRLGYSSGSDVSRESLETKIAQEESLVNNISTCSADDITSGKVKSFLKTSKTPPPIPKRDEICSIHKFNISDAVSQRSQLLTSINKRNSLEFDSFTPPLLKAAPPPISPQTNKESVDVSCDNPAKQLAAQEQCIATQSNSPFGNTTSICETLPEIKQSIKFDTDQEVKLLSAAEEGFLGQNDNQCPKTRPIPPPRSFSSSLNKANDWRINQNNFARPVVPPRKKRNSSSVLANDSVNDDDSKQMSDAGIKCQMRTSRPDTKPKPALPPRDFQATRNPALYDSLFSEDLVKQSAASVDLEKHDRCIESADALKQPSLRTTRADFLSKCNSERGKELVSSASNRPIEKLRCTKRRPLKTLISKKLAIEDIDLTVQPYSLQDGSWNIPLALVRRYSSELKQPLSDVVKAMDGLRIDLLIKKDRSYQPSNLKDAMKECVEKKNLLSVNGWLISIGLPMFIDGFCYLGLESFDEICLLSKEDVFSTGVYEERHIEQLFRNINEEKFQ